MKQILILITIIHLFVSLWACRLLEEILHTDVPEVESCTLNTDHFLLRFSTEMNQNLTELAFSLKQEENNLEGYFLWNDTELSFYPYSGITENRTYILNLEDSAEDEYGNSLIKSEQWTFHQGDDNTPPFILSVMPIDQSSISDLLQVFTITFSEPIEEISFHDSLEIAPLFKYSLEWADEGRSVTVHPLEALKEDREYCMTISTDLQDKAGNSLKQEFKACYKTVEREKLSMDSLVLDGSAENLSPGHITVEKDARLLGRLNRSADPDERYGLVTIKPETAFVLNWDLQYADFKLDFSENLEYGESYELRIMDQLYTLLCSGEESIPIAVEAVTFCAEDGVAAPREMALNQPLGAYDSDSAYLEFLLSHSPSGDINQTLFMKAFSIDSPVLSFNFISLELEDTAASGRSVIRVNMEVSDTGFPGTVRFSLEDSLSDNCDNYLDTNWSMTVNQP